MLIENAIKQLELLERGEYEAVEAQRKLQADQNGKKGLIKVASTRNPSKFTGKNLVILYLWLIKLTHI
jgi:hypothetical protein